MKKIQLAAAGLALLLLTGCSAKTPTVELRDGEQIQVQYDRATVKRGTVSLNEKYDAYVAGNVQKGSFPVSGPLYRVEVSIGQHVSEGDVIATLDTREAQRNLASAQQELSRLSSAAASDKQQAQCTVEIEQLSKQALVEKLSSLEAELNKAKAAPAEGEETTDNAALVASLEAEMTDVQNQITDKDFDIKEAQLNLSYISNVYAENIAYQQSLVEKYQEGLEGATLTAPCDGIVAKIANTAYGSWIMANTDFVYVEEDDAKLICYDGAADLYAVTDRVTANIGGGEYELELVEYSDSEYAQYVLKGLMAPARYQLKQDTADVQYGDYVQLTVHTKEMENALYIPVNCLYTMNSTSGYVYVLDGENKIYTEVTYEYKNSTWAVISSGLEEGDELYVKQ